MKGVNYLHRPAIAGKRQIFNGTSGRKIQEGKYLQVNRGDLTKPLKLGVSDFIFLLFKNTFSLFPVVFFFPLHCVFVL